MTLKANNRRYLVLRTDGCEKRGLDHSLSVFKGAVKEATYLHRTLVINKFSIHSKHNLGHHRENFEYKQYINLDKTQVYQTKQDGTIQQINSLFRYIDAEHFDLNEYPEKDILLMNEDIGGIKLITEEDNNRYDVIVRKTTAYNYRIIYPDILVSFHPSDEVEHLTDIVLKSLGTSLADAKKMLLTYQSTNFSTDKDVANHKMPDNPLYYAALHVRATDVYDTRFYNRYWNTAWHLKHIINRALSIDKGCKIYIMSDIRDRRYFDFLKKDYRVYRYFDFPELEALVSKNNDSEIDNAMLYSVEKNILQYAYTKIGRAKTTPRILYVNSSFNIPLLSLPPQYLHQRYLRKKFLAVIRRVCKIKRIKIAIRKIRKLLD